ncbi:PDZ domain-containing protein, partial [Sorangium cellulosum]|uniref:PDZ domain-containing protein n=2 Tax=Polyangiaceae TaxID=49 RepID=UPI003B9695FF
PPPALPVQRAAARHPGLGLTLRDAPAPRGPGREGGSIARIVAVASDSPAERAGLRPGDVILEADRNRAPTAAEVEEAARDGELLVRVQRRGAAFYAALTR